MSLSRLIYYSAILAGWAAFGAWAVAEFLVFNRLPSAAQAVVVGGLVGAAIGTAVNVAAALGGGGIAKLGSRAVIGAIGGGLGGSLGAILGNTLYGLGAGSGFGWLFRGVGWMLMGIGIGVIDGIQEGSVAKIRNGFIGGAIGGLVGGLLFDPLVLLIASASGMSSRAVALVALGLAIGGGVGLAQVVMREAWLTVVDGYRPGRQLLLTRPITVLGRGEHLPLPFIGAMNHGIAVEQLRIVRSQDGGFTLEDLGGGSVTAVNRQSVRGPVRLRDGDVVHVGSNAIRFNERRASSGTIAGGQQGDRQTGQPNASRPPVPVPIPPPPRPVRALGGASSSTPQPPEAPGPATAPRATPPKPSLPGSHKSQPPVPGVPPASPPRQPPPPPPPPPRPPR
jgi:hypothetical protein